MKTPVSARALRGALALPLLFGVPLLAQAVPAPIYRIDGTAQEVRITTTYREPVPQLLLVAPDRKVVTIGGFDFLANGLVVGFVPRAESADWVLPFPPPVVAKHDFHVQVLVLDESRLVGGPIVATRHLFEPQPFTIEPQKEPLVSVTTWLKRPDAGFYWFRAAFTATSDGYALYDAAVVRHDDVTDIYLALKTPGPGEGFRDIMQELEVTEYLGTEPGALVRVFAFTDPAPFATALDQYVGFALFDVGFGR